MNDNEKQRAEKLLAAGVKPEVVRDTIIKSRQAEKSTQHSDGSIGGVAVGVAKSAGDLALGVGQLGRGIQNATGLNLGNKTDAIDANGSIFDSANADRIREDVLSAKDASQSVGKFVGEAVQFAIPASRVGKATQAFRLRSRAATVGGVEAGVFSLNQGEIGAGTVAAGALGAAFPVGGAIANRLRKPASSLTDMIGAGTRQVDDAVVAPVQTVDLAARGFDESQQIVLNDLAQTPIDKSIARQIIEAAESPEPNRFAGDVVGANLVNDFKKFDGVVSNLGSQVDEVSNSLKGKQVDSVNLSASVDQLLTSNNITFTRDGLDFSNSVFGNNTAMTNMVNDYVKRISNAGDDAFKLHVIKRQLQDDINFNKQSTGVSASAERFLTDLQRSINNQLGEVSSEYKAANDAFAEAAQARDLIRKTFGDTSDELRAGSISRRVLSNAQSRGQVVDAIQANQAILEKYGIETGGNVVRQINLLPIVEDLYGTKAAYGLRGQVEGAITTVKAVSDGLRNPIQGVGSLAGEAVERIAGQTEEAQKKALKELFEDIDASVPTTPKKLEPEVEGLVLDLSKRLDESSNSSVPEYLRNNPQGGFVSAGTVIPEKITPQSVAKKMDDRDFDAIAVILEDVPTMRQNPAVNRLLDQMGVGKASDDDVRAFLVRTSDEYANQSITR